MEKCVYLKHSELTMYVKKSSKSVLFRCPQFFIVSYIGLDSDLLKFSDEATASGLSSQRGLELSKKVVVWFSWGCSVVAVVSDQVVKCFGVQGLAGHGVVTVFRPVCPQGA